MDYPKFANVIKLYQQVQKKYTFHEKLKEEQCEALDSLINGENTLCKRCQ